MPFAASCAVVFWMVDRSYTVSSAYFRAACAAAVTADESMPAKLMVFMNLSVPSDMAITSEVKPLTVSHRAVTPLTARPPRAEPNAAAFVVVLSSALTASSALPVILTDMMAERPMVSPLRFAFLLFPDQLVQAGAPVTFVGHLAPLPRRAAEPLGQQETQPAQRPFGPRRQSVGFAWSVSSTSSFRGAAASMSSLSTPSSHLSNGGTLRPAMRRAA